MGIKFGRSGAYLACTGYPDCQNTKNFKKDATGRIVVVEDETTDVRCEKCGSEMIRREGRWGPYLACSNYPACKNIVSLKGPKPQPRYAVVEGAEPPCPTCAKPMKLRVSKYGSHFWSCSTYPRCRGTAPFDTGLHCLEKDCKGTLVERLPRKKGAKKTPFWACNTCDFILGERPLSTPCPKCGHEFMTEHRPQNAAEDAPADLRCPKCGHTVHTEVPAAASNAS
jgi:DNA topoisomerase-1